MVGSHCYLLNTGFIDGVGQTELQNVYSQNKEMLHASLERCVIMHPENDSGVGSQIEYCHASVFIRIL